MRTNFMSDDKDDFVVCECQSEVLRLTKWKDDPNIGLTLYSTQNGNGLGLLWRRLKYAFRHIFTGHIGEDQMILDMQSLEKVWLWIGEHLKEEIPELVEQKKKELVLANERADELSRLNRLELIEKVQISMRYDSLREKLNPPEEP